MKKFFYKMMQNYRKKRLLSCGNDVRIAKKCDIRGNVCIADYVVVGEGCRFISTIAKIIVKDHVVFGPEVTIYSGDHRFDIIGQYLIDITDAMKDEKNDKDVIIESDVWIGTRAIILKGVTIGKGSIIGAGSIVTKSIPPYSIYTGTPDSKIRKRFTDEQIREHERLISQKDM